MPEENNENEKVGQVVGICPICGRKYRKKEDELIIITQYQIAVPQGIPPMYSQPKIACLDCGIEFFPLFAIAELRKKSKEGPSRIIMPQPKVKLN